MDLTKLCAKDLMQNDVKSVTEATPVLKAASLMRDWGVSSLVVERKNDNDALGIITRKDIVEALMSMMYGDIPMIVENHMTKPAVTVDSDLSIDQCYQMMKMIGIRRVPVVEGKKVIGILSNSDLFKPLIEKIS